jgi:hypothetical protein
MVMAIFLLDHPEAVQELLRQTKRPMILVSYSFVEPVGESFLLKDRWRSSSARRSETAPWSWGCIDHFGIGLWVLEGMMGGVGRWWFERCVWVLCKVEYI